MNDQRRSQQKPSPTKSRLRKTAEALLEAPWHTSLNYEDEDGKRSLLVIYPSYDPEDLGDEPMLQIESLQIDPKTETVDSTIQEWSPKEVARFCRTTLAALEVDGSLDDDDDDDDGGGGDDGSGDEEGDTDPDDDE